MVQIVLINFCQNYVDPSRSGSAGKIIKEEIVDHELYQKNCTMYLKLCYVF